MPRFSIKDLILATTMVAIGMAMVLVSLKSSPGEHLSVWGSVAVLHGGITMIGAGMMAPLHKKALGAAIGVALGLPLVVLVLASATAG